MCGIIGIYNNKEASTLAYMGLYAQQHRGQEAAGIVSSDGITLHRKMGQGLVSDVFSDGIFDKLPGNFALGHTRYSTTGSSDPKNVGPLLFNLNNLPISIAHNGNLVNLKNIRKELQDDGALFQTSTDTEIIIHLLAREDGCNVTERLKKALLKVKGAYSLLIITPNELIAARDPSGIRPFCIGKLRDSYVLVSETCALDLLGAEYLRDIEPGEILTMNHNGMQSEYLTEQDSRKHCIFEFVYFSRPDSKIFGENVDKLRRKLGKTLAEESADTKADLVISVPDSSNTAALGYASKSKAKFEIGLIRNHYVGRTFIFPIQRLRDISVRLKFNTVKGVLENKDVVIVDDSLVRGTTLKKLSKLLREAGVKKIHVRITSPPVRFPCHFGMDFPTEKELAANQYSVSGLRKLMDVDSLEYLSLDGLLNSMTINRDNFCTACFSGEYPIKINNKND